MNTIWKFPLLSGLYRFPVSMPRGARPLGVQIQGYDQPTLWALVDPAQPIEQRYLGIYGTGWDLPNDIGTYIGTFQREGGTVWHVFDLGT